MVKGASRIDKPQASGWGFLPVAAAFMLVLILVSPQGEFPLNDAWMYHTAVKQRLETGKDLIDLDTAAYLYPQRLYGTALARMFGFSFTLLRATGILAAFACLFLAYRILARLRFSTLACFAGTMALLANPIFLNLSYTFMTDLPYLALFLAALLFYIRAAQTGERPPLVAGVLFTIVALTQRQIGLLLTPAALLYFFVRRRQRPVTPADWAILLVPAIAFGALTMVLEGGRAESPGLGWILRPSAWAQLYNLAPLSKYRLMAGVDPLDFYKIVSFALPAYLGLFTLPLLLGALVRALRKRGVLPTALLTISALCAGGLFAIRGFLGNTNVAGRLQVASMPFLTNILGRCGVGPGAGDVLAGDCVPIFPAAFWNGITIAAVLSGGVLAAVGILWAFRNLRAFSWKGLAFPSSGDGRAELEGGGAGLVVLAGAFQAFPFFVVWPQDRYFIPLIIPAVVMVLEIFRNVRLSPAFTLPGLLAFYLFSVAAVHDYVSWNRVRWEIGRDLLAEGVPPEHIEGGFEWHGWRFAYTHSRRVKAKRTSPFLLWFAAEVPNLDPVYVISFGEIPGYSILRTREFPTHLLRPEARIYLLKRVGP